MSAEIKVLGIEVSNGSMWMNFHHGTGHFKSRVEGMDGENVYFDSRIAGIRLVPGVQEHISGFTGQPEFRIPRALHPALQ